MQVQVRNADMVDLLSADFVRNNDAALAWGTAIGMHLMIPALRLFWPMNVTNGGVQITDITGNGKYLAINGGVSLSLTGLASFAAFDGSTGYLQRADESIFDATSAAFGGWFHFDDAAGTAETLMSKYSSAAGQRSFRIFRNVSGVPSVSISKDGTNTTTTAASVAVGTGWHHIVASYRSSDGLVQLYVNGVRKTATLGSGSMFNSTAPFQVSGYDGTNQLLHGAASLCFFAGLAAAGTNNNTLFRALYYRTKALFGR